MTASSTLTLPCVRPARHAPHDSDATGGAREPHLVPARRRPAADPAGLAATFEQLRPRMHAVARRIVRTPEAADDVVQNALEKAIRGLDSFDGRARLSTWLHRIVVNESLMWVRAESRRRRRFQLSSETDRDPGDLADPDADPSRPLFEVERIERLRRGLAHLPAAERDVLEHCALAGQSYDEYARRSGIGSAAAKSRAFRARQRLRGWLRHT